MEGLNDLFKALFDVELKVASAIPGELWVEDVIKLAGKLFLKSYQFQS